MKFAIWGAGVRGRRLFKMLGGECVEIFIESSSDLIGKTCCGRPVISFEKYLKDYPYLFIIITPMLAENEIIGRLTDNKVYKYFRLSDCPPEFYGMDTPKIFEKFPYRFDKDKPLAVWGISLYSILLYDYLKGMGYWQLSLIPVSDMGIRYINGIRQYLEDYHIIDQEVMDKTADILVSIRCDENLSVKTGMGKEAVLDMFDFSDVFPEYYHSDLVKFKDMYRDRRCFIVATGPSLRMEDLDCLKANKEICFGMNQIYLAYDKTGWRPDFYVFSDFLVLGANMDEIRMLNDGELLFLMDDNEYTAELKGRDNVYEYHLHKEEYFNSLPKFSYNAANKMYRGYTVTYVCLQLAVYMGFKEIYLIGCDFTNYGNKQWNSSNTHFCSEYGQNRTGFVADTHDKVMLAYVSAKQHALSAGVKIYNATRGGELEVFDRVNFDDILIDNKEENSDEM